MQEGEGSPWEVFGVCGLHLLSGREKDLAESLQCLKRFSGAEGVSLWEVKDSLESGIWIQGLVASWGSVEDIRFPFPLHLDAAYLEGVEGRLCSCGELPSSFWEAAGKRGDSFLLLALSGGEFVHGAVSGFLMFAFEHGESRPGFHAMQGKVRQLYSQYMDRRTAFLRMQSRGEKYQSILEGMEEGFFEIDLGGNLLMFNDAICRISECSREELLGMNNREYTSPETAASMYQVFNRLYHTGKAVRIRDYEVILRDGRKKVLEISATLVRNELGKAVGFRGLLRDVTEKVRAMEERNQLMVQLQQSQRLEAIGTLAGGIAHDFNNLLMGIQGNVSLIRARNPAGKGLDEHLRSIEHCVASGANLTQQLLGFARGGKYRLETLDLNPVIHATISMFGRTRREIQWKVDLEEKLYPVTGDAAQIEQVLLNLFVNAWQAMPDGGTLTIRSVNGYMDGDAALARDMKPGAFVMISVQDTGEGMEESIRSRIFEPFFTTKEMGRGTGLGLASAFGILKGHGGHIDVESRPGAGSTFRLFFPASGVHRKEDGEIAAGEACLGRSMRILLVDDEAMVLEVSAAMLETMGCEVLSAASGREALACFERERDTLDLVILDMVMPDMGGVETFEALKRIRADVPVLISSGYSQNAQVEAMLAKGCVGFIQKPFTLETLSGFMERIFCG